LRFSAGRLIDVLWKNRPEEERIGNFDIWLPSLLLRAYNAEFKKALSHINPGSQIMIFFDLLKKKFFGREEYKCC